MSFRAGRVASDGQEISPLRMWGNFWAATAAIHVQNLGTLSHLTLLSGTLQQVYSMIIPNLSIPHF